MGASLKPRCALRVAVVGNRRFGGETDEQPTEAARSMKAAAEAACTSVWDVVLEAMRSVLDLQVPPAGGRHLGPAPAADPLRLSALFRDEPPQLTVLSALAAGADQFGARTALEVGRRVTGVTVGLEAVLPFREEDYPGLRGALRPEFRAHEAAALASLAAEAAQVVRLDGWYGDTEARHRAYQQCRDLLFHHADLVLAVYDPRAVGGVGGTGEAVRQALSVELPVVAVLVTERETRVAVYPGSLYRPPATEEWDLAGALDDEEWRAQVRDRVWHLLALPHQLEQAGESAHERKKREEALAKNVARLRRMYGEVRPHVLARGRVLGRIFGGAWRAVLRVGARWSPPHEFRTHTPRPHPAGDAIGLAPYAGYYHQASALSGAYMRTYRGAFVLAFLLAGVAVGAAVSLMAWSLLTGGHPPMVAITVLGGLKILVIAALLVLERASHQGRYQEHATDFRYLAELLRPMQWLAPAGTTVPSVELPTHFAPLDPRRGWTTWLFRAIAREAPLVVPQAARGAETGPRAVSLDAASARAALERASSQWVQGQIRYHWTNAQSMHGIDRGLERLAKALLWVVLVCAIVAVGLELLPRGLPEPWPGRLEPWHPLAIVVGAVAAGLPAFIAALGGIMFQSEARRLAIRSEAMYFGLEDRQAGLRVELARLDTVPSRGGEAWQAAWRLRSLAAEMIEETGDWKVLYQTHDVHAG